MPVSRPKQAFGLALVALALLWPVLGDRIQAALTRDKHGCQHSSDIPEPTKTAQARAAVLCLLNHERAAHGLAPLAQDPLLQAAAQAHGEDMGRRDFYAHTNPDGTAADTRMRAAGFNGRMTGENIHWGVGVNASPARIVADWMNSPGHRANILRAGFDRVGIGIGHDAPELLSDGHAGVYVNDFGGA